MSDHRLDRRRFLAATGLAAGSLTFPLAPVSGSGGGGGGPVRVRKEVNALSTDEVDQYRSAVKALRARADDDPKGWRAQALIHQNFCPHGNWFFLPWHRAYLLYFEAICREALGPDSTFSLPYWDWTANTLLPAAFWGADNPLNDPSREIDPNDPIPPEFTGAGVIANILEITDFETFGSGKALAQRPTTPPLGSTGQLEGVPHNNVHGLIGGNMGAYMSPLDPIFWLHHANIDRLWAMWAGQHPDGTTTDPDWLGYEVTGFVDTAGQDARRKVSDLLGTYALGYRYDTQPEQPPAPIVAKAAPPAVPEGFRATAEPATSASAVSPLSQPVALAPALREHVATAARAAVRPQTIRLVLRDVPIPDNPRFMVRVFLNAKDPTARTPIGDPSYVGSFGFFEHPHAAPAAAGKDHAAMKGGPVGVPTRTFTFDISEVVRRLQRAGRLPADGDLKVSLVPVPFRRGVSVLGEVKPAKIEIVGLK
jgi:tyrosinase